MEEKIDVDAPVPEDEDLFHDIFKDDAEENINNGGRTPMWCTKFDGTSHTGTSMFQDDFSNAQTPCRTPCEKGDEKENTLISSQTPGGSRIKWLQKEWQNPCLQKMITDRRNAYLEVKTAREVAAAEAAPATDRDLNDFERALIRLKGPKRGKDRLPDASANQEAQKLVKDMKEAQETDVSALRSGQYACCKITMLNTLIQQVSRANMAEHFVFLGGVDGIADWLSPIDAPGVAKHRRQAAPQVINGLLKLLLKLSVGLDDIKSSRIGIVVKNILHDKRNKLEDRRIAQNLIHKWLSIITNPKPTQDDDADADMEPPKKRVKPSDEHEAAPLLKPRRDEHFWDATEEQVKEWETHNKVVRHARVPMDKPLFDKQALPNVEVKTKYGWNKTDPGTIRGKVDRRVQRMANPNKKAWKNAVSKNVSVEGRGLNLSFQN